MQRTFEAAETVVRISLFLTVTKKWRVDRIIKNLLRPPY